MAGRVTVVPTSNCIKFWSYNNQNLMQFVLL